MATELELKRRIYSKLQNDSVVGCVFEQGKSIMKNPAPCTLYYNRNLGEITEENMGSFKKVTVKFIITRNMLAKDINKISQVNVVMETEDGSYDGFLVNYKCDKEFKAYDAAFSFSVTFKELEDGSFVLSCEENSEE